MFGSVLHNGYPDLPTWHGYSCNVIIVLSALATVFALFKASFKPHGHTQQKLEVSQTLDSIERKNLTESGSCCRDDLTVIGDGDNLIEKKNSMEGTDLF